MTGDIRLPSDLGRQLRTRREALGLSKSALAKRAGKVREVVYRLEAGEDTTISSLFAVMSALGLVLHVEQAGLPSASEVAARFLDEDDDAPQENSTVEYVHWRCREHRATSSDVHLRIRYLKPNPDQATVALLIPRRCLHGKTGTCSLQCARTSP